jgi:hypothetical protein
MTDAPQQQSAFRALLGNRLVQVLAAIAALIAIVGEGAVVYTNIQKAQIELEAKRNAEKLKAAEADKLAAEAAAAKETAANAKERQAAEAKLATQKAEIELQAARNAERLKAAEAAKMEADAAISRNNIAKSAAEADTAQSQAAVAKEASGRAKAFYSGTYNASQDLINMQRRSNQR